MAVGLPLAVAAWVVDEVGGEIDDATTVLGAGAVVVVTSIGGTRGDGLEELGMVTGTGSVTAAVCGASVVGTGDVATVVVTGGTLTAGAGAVGGGGDAARTDAVI